MPFRYPVVAGETTQDRNRRLKRERKEKRRAVNPAKFEQRSREQWLLYKHKLDLMDWHTLYNEQAGLCAICFAPATDVDHDHRTGRIRGLLCGSCNRALGLLQDDPQRARN